MGVTVAERPIGKAIFDVLEFGLSRARARAFETLAFAVPFTIYALSAGRDVSSWDTAEMQGVPYILGIAHPTGFPLYVIVGFLFSHIIAIGTVAFRLNLLAAACVAGSCAALYVASREIQIPRICGLIAAWWFGIGAIVWNHAIRAEVHDLALLLSTASLVYWIRWVRDGAPEAPLYATAAFGLALATHPMAIWLAPGAALALALRRPDKKSLMRGAIVVVSCLALYAYLPVRSFIIVHAHLDPTAGLAGQDGGVFWNLNNPSTWAGLMDEISGSQFGAGKTLVSAINADVLQGYLWNWLGAVNSAYGAYGLILAFVGLIRLWTKNARVTLLQLVFCLAIVPFSYAYGNVEGDSDRYRMLPLWLVPLLMAAATAAGEIHFDFLTAMARKVIISALMLIWTIETFQNNRGIFMNSGDTNRAIITEAAARVPRRAILVSTWVDATTLAYGAYVEHALDRRIIIASWPNGEKSHFAAWLKVHPVFVIWPSRPEPYPGITYIEQPALDAGHRLWMVKSTRTNSSGVNSSRTSARLTDHHVM